MTPYDSWKLTPPDDERHAVGTEDGQPCGRYHEPDEDAPRGYKPKPCPGVMVRDDDAECAVCDTCGEMSNG